MLRLMLSPFAFFLILTTCNKKRTGFTVVADLISFYCCVCCVFSPPFPSLTCHASLQRPGRPNDKWLFNSTVGTFNLYNGSVDGNLTDFCLTYNHSA